MRKLDLILEDIRDEYMINLLEEGETNELETLKTKKFLQENLNRIRKMLIEEGALEGVKQHLGDNWGKYLGGAGALGAGALANHYMGGEGIEDTFHPEGEAGPNTQEMGGRIADASAQNAQSAATGNEMDFINNPNVGYNNMLDKAGAIQNFDPTNNAVAPNVAAANVAAANVGANAPDPSMWEQVKAGISNYGSPQSNIDTIQNAGQVNQALDQSFADGINPTIDAEAAKNIADMNAGADSAKAKLAGYGAAGAAGLGAAGYGAKKLADRYR